MGVTDKGRANEGTAGVPVYNFWEHVAADGATVAGWAAHLWAL